MGIEQEGAVRPQTDFCGTCRLFLYVDGGASTRFADVIELHLCERHRYKGVEAGLPGEFYLMKNFSGGVDSCG